VGGDLTDDGRRPAPAIFGPSVAVAVATAADVLAHDAEFLRSTLRKGIGGKGACWAASGTGRDGSCRHRADDALVEVHRKVQADVVAADLEMPIGLDAVG